MYVRSFKVIDGRVACPYRGELDVDTCYRCRRLRAFHDEESGTRVVCVAPLRSLLHRHTIQKEES
jgi:hypothetical protein